MSEEEENGLESTFGHYDAAMPEENKEEAEFLQDPVKFAMEANIMIQFNRAFIAICSKAFDIGNRHIQDAMELAAAMDDVTLIAQCRFWEGLLYAKMEREKDACATFLGALGMAGDHEFHLKFLLGYLSDHWQTTISVINEHYGGDSKQISELVTALRESFKNLDAGHLGSTVRQTPSPSSSAQLSSILFQSDQPHFKTTNNLEQLSCDGQKDEHASIWKRQDPEMSATSTTQPLYPNETGKHDSKRQISTISDGGGRSSAEELYKRLLNDVCADVVHEELVDEPIINSDQGYTMEASQEIMEGDITALPFDSSIRGQLSLERDDTPGALDNLIEAQRNYRPARRRRQQYLHAQDSQFQQ